MSRPQSTEQQEQVASAPQPELPAQPSATLHQCVASTTPPAQSSGVVAGPAPPAQNPEMVAHFMKLYDAQRHSFDRRSAIEWKMSISLWIAVSLAAWAVVDAGIILAPPTLVAIGLLFFFVWLLYAFMWIPGLMLSHSIDAAFCNYYRMQVQYHLGVLNTYPTVQPNVGDLRANQYKWNFHRGHYCPWTQIIWTLLVLALCHAYLILSVMKDGVRATGDRPDLSFFLVSVAVWLAAGICYSVLAKFTRIRNEMHRP